MEHFNASGVTDDLILFNVATDIDRCMKLLNDGENFIISWNERETVVSKLMLATNLIGKVRTGEITLIAKQVK
jgi:hypothetical protein